MLLCIVGKAHLNILSITNSRYGRLNRTYFRLAKTLYYSLQWITHLAVCIVILTNLLEQRLLLSFYNLFVDLLLKPDTFGMFV